MRVYAEQADAQWERVSEGWLVGTEAAGQQPDVLNLEALRKRLEPRGGGEEFYAQLASRGLKFGERFRGVEQVWVGADEALGEIVSRGEEDEENWELRPWWLDACLQVAGLTTGGDDDGALYLPLSLERLEIYRHPGAHWMQPAWSHVTTRRLHADTLAAEVTVTTPAGSPLVRINNLRFRKSAHHPVRTAIYGVEWIEATQEIPATQLHGHWVVLAEENEFREEISNQLRRRGATCSLVQTTTHVSEQDTNYLPSASLAKTREVLRDLVRSHGQLEGVLDLRSAGEWNLLTGEPQDTSGMDASLSLLQALLLEQVQPSRGVWLITRNSEQSADPSLSAGGRILQALRRTAMLEFPELAVHSLDLDATAGVGGVFRALAMNLEEMIVRGECIFVPRLVERDVTAGELNTGLIPAESGLIEDLKYIAVEREAPQEDEVEIAVEASGVNFRDVMNTLGMLPGSPSAWAESVRDVGLPRESGFRAGDRVVAFALGSFRTFVTVTASNAARSRHSDARAGGSAAGGLSDGALGAGSACAALQAGESVLIHSAAGGLGLAAVQVARARGAEIYATAGSEEKRAYLRSLGIQHVLPSRTNDFAAEVMRLTGGRGVDVVLNSLTGVLAERRLSVWSYGGVSRGWQARHSEPGVSPAGASRCAHFVYDLARRRQSAMSLVPSLMREMLECWRRERSLRCR